MFQYRPIVAPSSVASRDAGFTECSTVRATGFKISSRAMVALLVYSLAAHDGTPARDVLRLALQDDFSGAELGDPPGAVAVLGEHLVGVLALARGRRADAWSHPRELQRGADDGDLAEPRVHDPLEDLARRGLRVLHHLVHRVHGRGRHASLLEDLRSEEHTSELQSHSDLVCRLLLEKKKKYNVKRKLEQPRN